MHGKKFPYGLLPLILAIGQDHVDDGGESIHSVEHPLRSTEPNPLCPQFSGSCGILGGIGIGHNAEDSDIIGPLQKRLQVFIDFGFDGGNLAQVNVSRRAIDGDEFPLRDLLRAEGSQFLLHVDEEGIAADDAGLSHGPRDHGRVGRFPTPAGEDPLCPDESVDVFGLRLLPHQDDILPEPSPPLRLIHIENGSTSCRAR